MKLALIGCGLISASHAQAIRNIPGAELVAACDVRREAAERTAREYGCAAFADAREMLDAARPDAAVICLPTYFHADHVALCAERGVHVLCEKPLERSAEAAARLIGAAERSGIVFMTAQVVRFWPGYVDIKRMFDAGEIGDVYMMHLRRVSSRAGEYGGWLFEPDLGGGAMHDMLVHDVDFLRYVGGEFDYCYANARADATGCYNNVMANIVHKNGWHAVAEASFNQQAGYPFSFSVGIVGSLATVEYFYSAGATIADRSGSRTELKVWRKGREMENVAFESYDAYQRQMEYFVGCVGRGEQPEVITPRQSYEVIAMIDAIHRSADTNSIVHV